MARVAFRVEVIEQGELGLVSPDALKKAVKRLKETPEFGKPLRRALMGCRSFRVDGDKRLVYRVHPPSKKETEPLVEVLAIGPRRDEEAYEVASKRLT